MIDLTHWWRLNREDFDCIPFIEPGRCSPLGRVVNGRELAREDIKRGESNLMPSKRTRCRTYKPSMKGPGADDDDALERTAPLGVDMVHTEPGRSREASMADRTDSLQVTQPAHTRSSVPRRRRTLVVVAVSTLASALAIYAAQTSRGPS